MIDEIKYLYPNAVPLVDFVLQDNSDGNGPFITQWNETKLGPKPTKTTLGAVSAAAIAAKNAAVESSAAAKKIADASLAVLPDLIAHIATRGDAPQSIKNTDTFIRAEKLKIK